LIIIFHVLMCAALSCCSSKRNKDTICRGQVVP
jgi:hypothetical protein